MTQTGVHGRQLKDGTIADSKLVNTPIHQDGSNALTADLDLGSHKAKNMADPVSDTDGVNLRTLNNAKFGMKWKDPVRVATLVAGTLASSFANGQTVDGKTLVTGDRIFIKNQADGKENGIYVVAASGAPSRAADANASSQILQMTVMVEEGSQADELWTCTNDGTITLGTTVLTFAQVGIAPTPINFADEEVPTGTVNGSNPTFTLAHAPISGSLKVHLNGIRQTAGGVDYTLSASTITYVSAPVTGDSHVADYRY